MPTRCPLGAHQVPNKCHQVPTRCPLGAHPPLTCQLFSNLILDHSSRWWWHHPSLGCDVAATSLDDVSDFSDFIDQLKLFITIHHYHQSSHDWKRWSLSTTVNSHDPSFYHHLFEKFTVNLLIWFIQMARIFHQDSSLPPRHPGKDFWENYYKYWTNIVSNWKYWAGIQRERLRVLCLFNCA